MAFALNIHDTQNGTVVAACDRDLLGETFQDGDITLTVKQAFYDGEDADVERIHDETQRATTTNFVGEHLITALIDRGTISEDEVQYVDGVPHVQLFFV